MPLFKAKSKFQKEEMASGSPKSLAIAYHMKRKGMAHGGMSHAQDEMCEHGGPEMCAVGCYAEGGEAESPFAKESKRMHGGYKERMGPTGPTGYKNRNKSSDMSGGQRKGPQGYPKYQEQSQNQKGVHVPVSGVTAFPGGKGTSRAGAYTKSRYGSAPLFSGKDHPAIEEHKKVLHEMRSMKSPKLLSEGGMIANDDEDESDFLPNQFDDLALRDDLESHYTGANSGDELSDEGEDERRRDMVSRIMATRRKRAGHNPRPA